MIFLFFGSILEKTISLAPFTSTSHDKLTVVSLPVLDKKINDMQRGSIRQQHCEVENGLPRFL